MRAIKLIISILFALAAGAVLGCAIGINPLVMGPVLIALGAIPKPAGLVMFNFADLPWTDNKKNMAGIKTIGYYAPVSEIDNFPELPSNPTSAAEEVTLEGSPGFTFAVGKFFRKLYLTFETSEIKDDNQGERDGQSFKHTAEFFFPGTEAEALAFAANVNNTGMVFIFEEVSGGNRRVIGSKAIPAMVKCSFTTGKAVTDRKGMTVTVEGYGYTPAPLYDGVIRLDGEFVS